MILTRTFRAMGTEVEVFLEPEPGANGGRALAWAEAEFERLEQVLSRFRPDSELSQLNREEVIEASHDLVRVVRLALAARERDRRALRPDRPRRPRRCGVRPDIRGDLPAWAPACAETRARCGGSVAVDGLTIRLEPGTHLDLGGIGKGYAVDRVADRLAVTGNCLVNAGGDMAVRGGAWPIAVTGDLTLELTCGGIATSGRDRRNWRRGDEDHAPPDRSANGPASRDGNHECDRHRRLGGRGGGTGEDRIPRSRSGCAAGPRYLDGAVVLAGGLA